jgi:hypothetical protein
MKLSTIKEPNLFVEIPSQDLYSHKSLTYTEYKAVCSDTKSGGMMHSRFDDNIFKFYKKSQKMLKKKIHIKKDFQGEITHSYFFKESYILLFFEKRFLLYDLKNISVKEVDKAFPKFLRCEMLRNSMLMILIDSKKESDQKLETEKTSNGRSILIFNFKTEKFKKMPELTKLNILDFLLVNDILLLLVGK